MLFSYLSSLLPNTVSPNTVSSSARNSSFILLSRHPTSNQNRHAN